MTANAGTVTQAKGAWIVPAVNCTVPNTDAAAWVGIDVGNPTIEQVGTDSSCNQNTPDYYAWYEFYPANPVHIPNFPVQPGDVISASVSYSGGTFTFTLTDKNSGQKFQTSQTWPAAQLASAECILENAWGPNPPVANFGTIDFGRDGTGVAGTCDATIGGVTGPLGSFANVQATIMDNGNVEAVPSTFSPDNSSFTVSWVKMNGPLVSFDDGANGGFPYAGLIEGLDGNFYSTATQGGAYNAGVVFSVASDGTVTVLHSFCAVQDPWCTDGNELNAGVIQGTDGNFYGTTNQGGARMDFAAGSIFKLDKGGTLTTLYSFCAQPGCTDGSRPYAGLVQGTDGEFYGTTYFGGATYHGTVFSINSQGAYTLLYSFCSQSGCADGEYPFAGLVQGADGDFYGTTSQGGTFGAGTVFKITRLGALTTLYNFCPNSGCPDGDSPSAGVIQAADRNFYGTTRYGGEGAGGGTIFRLTSGGKLTTLYSFCSLDACADGEYPYAGLVQATDGNFYGTTDLGGTDGHGTVFKITAGGEFTTLHNFVWNDGANPNGGLVQGTDGSFYGTTFEGVNDGGNCGANGCGSVFNISVGLGEFVDLIAASGKVGAVIEIVGTNLCGATQVLFDGTPASFTPITCTEITATVPVGATTGRLQVVVPAGTLRSNVFFLVRPQILSYSPAKGPVGTVVSIDGESLTQATKVTFGGVKATTFTVNSDTLITATVPHGAKTGKIVVTTPGGAATSKTLFTVQ